VLRDSWPRSLRTSSRPAPLRSHDVAAECRTRDGTAGGVVASHRAPRGGAGSSPGGGEFHSNLLTGC
jgi:hypothetical protein